MPERESDGDPQDGLVIELFYGAGWGDWQAELLQLEG